MFVQTELKKRRSYDANHTLDELLSEKIKCSMDKAHVEPDYNYIYRNIQERRDTHAALAEIS